MITDLRNELAEGITPQGKQRSSATVNRYLAALSVCMSYGVKECGWIKDNPVFNVKVWMFTL